MQRIEESKSESDSATKLAKIQVPIIPYERLAPLPEGILRSCAAASVYTFMAIQLTLIS